jgi:hypothetical protein
MPADTRRRTLAVACEASAVVVVVMALLARLHPAPAGPTLLPWERPMSSLSPDAATVARAAFAALADIERGVASGAPPAVEALADDLVPPFSDPVFSFVQITDGEVTGYLGRSHNDAAVVAVLLHVQPTVAPPSGIQDEEHHRVVDPTGVPHWLHGSVWLVLPGQPAPASSVAAPAALGYLRVRPL